MRVPPSLPLCILAALLCNAAASPLNDITLGVPHSSHFLKKAPCNPLVHCAVKVAKCVANTDCRNVLQCSRLSMVNEGNQQLMNLTNWVPCTFPYDRKTIFPLTECFAECEDPQNPPKNGGVIDAPLNGEGKCHVDAALAATRIKRFDLAQVAGDWWLSAGMTVLDWFDCQHMTIARVPEEDAEGEERWGMREYYQGVVTDFDGKVKLKHAEDMGYFTQPDKTNLPASLEYLHDRPYSVMSYYDGNGDMSKAYFVLYYCASVSGTARNEKTVWWTSLILYTKQQTIRPNGPEVAALRAAARAVGYPEASLRLGNNDPAYCSATAEKKKMGQILVQ